MTFKNKKIAVLSPVAWRTPPRHYGAWETVAGNITEGLADRGWDVTLFATGDSITRANLHAVVQKGYEEMPHLDAKVCECLHISELMNNAHMFDLIHNNYDFLPLTYSGLIETPMLTTIHGFSSPEILKVYRRYKNLYYVSISDSDRDPELPYLATVYNGIDLDKIKFHENPGDKLVFLGRIHPDKGTHLAIELAHLTEQELVIAGIIQDQNYFDKLIKPHIDGCKIEFIGPVNTSQKNDLFKRAKAVLHLNTIPERFGLVMAEANAAGVPVIAMDLGSCREVIEDGKTGFLVKNLKQAAKAINSLDRINPQACRMRVKQNFSIEKMVSDYEKVYDKIFKLENKKTGRFNEHKISNAI